VAEAGGPRWETPTERETPQVDAAFAGLNLARTRPPGVRVAG
jgi:hypothetical protein